jgi:hypothetical protein
MRGNIGAEIDVIKPALPAQTHAPDCYSLRFRSFAHFVPPCGLSECRVAFPNDLTRARDGGTNEPDDSTFRLKSGKQMANMLFLNVSEIVVSGLKSMACLEGFEPPTF